MGYIFNSNLQSPDDIARERQLADLLSKQSQQQVTTAPGVLGVALSGLGSLLANRKANAAQKTGQDKAAALWQSMLSGNQSQGGNVSRETPSSAGPISKAADAIASIESGGKYDALGPVTKKGDRAYGKYQVMGANIPEWSQAALGRQVSPQEYLANPQIQDAVFNHRFGGYMDKYGPQDAASMWFTGRPLAQGANASDQLGTTGQQYADKFMRGFQGGSGNGIMDRFNALKQAGIGRSSVQPAGAETQANPFLQAIGDPAFQYLSPQQQQLAIGMYQQQQQQSDPMYQMKMQAAQQDLQMGNVKMDQMLHPQMSPYEQAQIGIRKDEMNRPQVMGAGSAVYDPKTNKIIMSNSGETARAKPAEIQEYEYAKEQGFPGSFMDYQASKKGGMQLSVDPSTGQVTFQQGSNIKPLTEGQSKDVVFSTRAEGALKTLEPNVGALTELTGATVGQLPGVGNYAKSNGYQKAEQAGTEFLQAILRKDTGAAITPQEKKEYWSVYMPSPGDGTETLMQKKAARQRAVDALKGGMTPQAILAQERALQSGQQPPPAAPPPPQPQSGPINPSAGNKYGTIKMPDGLPMDIQSVWDYMTDDERKAFLK